MKTFLTLLTVLAAGTAVAQPGHLNPSATTQTAPPAQMSPMFVAPEKPNEIRRGRITYDGIAVEAAKVKNPLQLINPLAPPEYGSGEDNVLHDPITGQAAGLKALSIHF